MARAVSKDAPLRMLGNYVQTSPQAIIFFADQGYKTLKDLVGKKVSFTAGDALHQNWPALLEVAGVPRDQIQEVLLASAAKQTAVITGVVDAMGGYYTSQAGVIERETGKKVSWIAYADNGVNVLTLGLFMNTKYAGDRAPELPHGARHDPCVGGGREGRGRRHGGAAPSLPAGEQGGQGPDPGAVERQR